MCTASLLLLPTLATSLSSVSCSSLVLQPGFPPHHYTETEWSTLWLLLSPRQPSIPKLQQHLAPVTDTDDQFMLLEAPSLVSMTWCFPGSLLTCLTVPFPDPLSALYLLHPSKRAVGVPMGEYLDKLPQGSFLKDNIT